MFSFLKSEPSISPEILALQQQAKAGNAQSQFLLGLELLGGERIAQDINLSTFWFSKSAVLGNMAGQHSFAMALAEGIGCAKDEKQAAIWYRLSAEQGYPPGQFCLAAMLAAGKGCEKNEIQAAFWCRKAAEQGMADAQNVLAGMLVNCPAIPQNINEAIDWYRKAALQGHVLAQTHLAKWHSAYPAHTCLNMTSCPLIQSYDHVLSSLSTLPIDSSVSDLSTLPILPLVSLDSDLSSLPLVALDAGIPSGTVFQTPFASSTGSLTPLVTTSTPSPLSSTTINTKPSTVERKISKEMQNLYGSAKAGDANAQLQLGEALWYADGVPEDKNEAITWFYKAAIMGLAEAECWYGYALLNGEGIQQNQKQAAIWFIRAAHQGSVQAQVSLGEMFATGQGVDKDLKQAVEWYRKAANQGDEYSQTQLAALQPLLKSQSPSKPLSVISSTTSVTTSSIEILQQEFQQQLNRHQVEMELKLQRMIESVQNDSKGSSFKTEKQIIDAVMKQLLDKEESSFVRQSKPQDIEDDLQNLERISSQLQAEITALKEKSSSDPLIQERIERLEQQLQPLSEEYEEKQILLQAQQYICQSLPLKTFYNRVQVKLNRIFLAYMVIASGEVDRSADMKNTMITLLDKPLSILTLGLGTTITNGINTAYNRKQVKEITGVTEKFIISTTASAAIVERVARLLTSRYEAQIEQTTVPGQESFFTKITLSVSPNGSAETLAECAVARMVDALRDDKIREENSLEEQLVNCVFQDTSKDGLIPFTHQSIENTAKKKWTAQGIFRQSGITTGKQWFAKGKDCCQEPELYGYRLGTLEEAASLKLVQQLPPSETAKFHTSPALGKQITGVTADAKSLREKQEFQNRQLLLEKERNAKLAKKVEELESMHQKERTDERKANEETKKQVAILQQQMQQFLMSGAASGSYTPTSLSTSQSNPHITTTPVKKVGINASPASIETTKSQAIAFSPAKSTLSSPTFTPAKQIFQAQAPKLVPLQSHSTVKPAKSYQYQ